MADTAVAITAGTGTNVDTRTEATNGNHRQVIVIGDPSTNAGVAPVDATKGLAVDLTASGALPTVTAVTTVSTVTNLSQMGGAALAMGTGVRSAGTQRVTIATDDSVPVTIASVPSHAVTNAGTFVVQENGAAATSLALIDDTITAQGTALGSVKTSLQGGSVTTAAPSYTTGQISPLSLDTAGALRVTGAGGGTQYTEDVAAAADPIGNMLVAVRRDTLSASEVSADGDNIALKATSKGKLHAAAELYVGDAAVATGSGAMGATVPRVALATDSPGVIATAAPGTLSAAGPSVTAVNPSNYETVAASQTAQALGATGATGDFINGLLVVPATTSPGQVLLLDNATSITVFVGGATSVSNLVPFFIPLGMTSVSGAWKVTTGTNVSVIGVGKFT